MVDVIFADVAQPDQARIVSINAQNFLKNQGHFVISIKVRGERGRKREMRVGEVCALCLVLDGGGRKRRE